MENNEIKPELKEENNINEEKVSLDQKETDIKLKQLDLEVEKEERRKKSLESWIPKTKLGKLVKTGNEKDIDKILEQDKKILEPEIVDALLVGIESDLLLIGQAKGKFGG